MSKKTKIAFFFIGQSPRPDIMEGIYKTLGLQYSISEHGALDGLSPEDISALAPSSSEDTLITKLSDGSQVRVSEKAVQKLLEQKILDIASKKEADVAAIMCTGEFHFNAPIPVVTADEAFHKLQSFSAGYKKIGLIVPRPEQQKVFADCYKSCGLPVITAAADPYGDDAVIVSEAARLAREGADVICLDCMGYTEAQALLVSRSIEKESRVPRLEIVKAIKEII